MRKSHTIYAALTLLALASCGPTTGNSSTNPGGTTPGEEITEANSDMPVFDRFEGELERNITLQILENDTAKSLGYLDELLNAFNEEYAEYDNIKDVKGSVFHFITSEFKKLGYQISYALLNAANYGVPEKRERVFIIGHRGHRVPLPSPTHSEHGNFDTRPWVTLRDCIGDMENRSDLHYIPLRKNSIPYMEKLTEGQNWRNLPEETAKEAMGKAYYLSGSDDAGHAALPPHTAATAGRGGICAHSAISRRMALPRTH